MSGPESIRAAFAALLHRLWWTRTPDGVLVARFFLDDKPFTTDSVDAAYDYSVTMARRRQKRRA